MQSIGSTSIGLRWLRQNPGNGEALADRTRRRSAHSLTRMGGRGATARAMVCAISGRAGWVMRQSELLQLLSDEALPESQLLALLLLSWHAGAVSMGAVAIQYAPD